MRFLRFLFLICIALLSGTLNAQNQRELSQLMRERGEYYFTLSVAKPSEIQAISNICSIDGTDGKMVVAYANQQEYDRLLKAGYKPTLQTPPSMRANVTMWNGQGTYNWDSYLTYPQYVSMMEEFPDKAISGRNCTMFSLGTLATSNHRQLLGVRINNGSPEGKPKFLYSSTMHGDEITGMILMLRLINELCTSTDSQIVDLVNNLDIYILPLTNPDGTYKGGNNTVNSAQRYNGNNVDLNRNYKDYYQGVHPDGNDYEDETIWTMAFGDENLFTMSANYHGGAEVMNYPWDAVYDDHVDKDWYEHVCTEYVQIARQTYSSYMSDTYSDGVTSGAAWYVITGSRQDYMNAYAQCREVTVECSTTKTPSASQLPSFWNYNRNSMLAFMEQALKGVHGFVYDAVTGSPLEGVTVTVDNHDIENSYVTTHSIGDFHRPIKGGTYTFTFTKQGYYPQSVQVTVADDQRVELNDIQLTPDYRLIPDFTASTTNVSFGQSISFTDASTGTVTAWSWTFEGAIPSTSTEQNPTGITYNEPGDYDVTLTITGPDGSSEMTVKEDYIHVAESIVMQDGTITTCSGMFYDAGGPDSNYGDQLDYTMVFYPGNDKNKVSVSFSSFDLESNYDFLYIYDGTSTSDTEIGKYSGTTGPGTVTATNDAGALTFRFTSDYSVNNTGWVATISCVFPGYSITATANPAEYGTVLVESARNRDELVYNFEDGWQGWTALKGTTGNSPHNWMHNTEYVAYGGSSQINVSSAGHNSSSGMMLSESYISATSSGSSAYGAVTPDNYLVSPQIRLGGSISFYAASRLSNYPAEKFSVLVSESGNSSASDFTHTELTVTLSNTSWKEYTVDLSAYSGMGYIAIRHYDCYDQHLLYIDDITIVEGSNGSTDSGTFDEGAACTVTAIPNDGYYFMYWTENDTPVSVESAYTFTVDGDRDLVANFSDEPVQNVELKSGWNWWSSNINVTLAELKAALIETFGNTYITIKSKDNTTFYDGTRWKGKLTSLDATNMYMIKIDSSGLFTMTGPAIDPAECEITIKNGANWIVYPLNESVLLNNAFAGLNPVEGDVVKSKDNTAFYDGIRWKGKLTKLEPGQGYIYRSTAAEEKTFTFTTNNK